MPFQFDDYGSIVSNQTIRDIGNFVSSFDASGYNSRRLIGYLSFALNYHFGGLDTVGYHVVNLAIHILNAVLVYFLVVLTFRTPYFRNQRSAFSSQQSAIGDQKQAVKGNNAVVNSDDSTTQQLDSSSSPFTIHDSRLIAFFSALFFVVHPIQTQAVTYIVQRFTSLSALFYLLSVVMYIKGRSGVRSMSSSQEVEWSGNDSTTQRLNFSLSRLSIHRSSAAGGPACGGRFTFHASRFTILWYLISLISAVLAMKTKEIAFTLPLVILLYEIIFFKSPAKKMLLLLLPVLLTLLIIPLSLMQSDKPLGEILSDLSEKTHVQTQMPRWDYLMTEMRVIVTYIRLIFLPVNQNLDYDYPIYHSFFDPNVFLSFLLLSALFGTALYLLHKSRLKVGGRRSEDRGFSLEPRTSRLYRLISFGILWFFITLSVESSVIPIADVIFEHRLYLPLVGALTAITSGILLAADRLKIEKVVIPVLVCTTLLLSGLTYARNAVWKDQISLWQDVVEKSPNKARPHANLGYAYISQGQWDRAITEFQTALRIRHSAQDHYNLGVAYGKKGLTEMATEQYRMALSAEGFAKPYNNLGVLYASRGRLDEAIKHFQKAIQLQPTYALAHNNLGKAYQEKGLIGLAIDQYQLAIKLDPNNPGFRDDLAKAIQRRHGEAETN